MAKLHQIQMTYSSVEDRVLLQIRTMEGQAFLFWLTRRYVGILWRVLAQMLGAEVMCPPGIEPVVECHVSPAEPPPELFAEATRQTVQADQIDNAIPESGGPDSQIIYPLGKNPILLANIGAKKQTPGDSTLSLHPERGEGIEIVVNLAILRSLCQLLKETAVKAEWHIPLGFTPEVGRGGRAQEGLN